MNRHFPLLMIGAGVLALAGCSTVVVEPAGGGVSHPAGTTIHAAASGGSYVVAKGDTLYSIAFRKGVDYRDLAKWNGIAVPYTIWPGQHLQLSQASGGSAGAPVVASTATAAKTAPPVTSAQAAPPPPAAPMFEDVPTTPVPAPTVAHAPIPAPSSTVAHAPAPASVPMAAPAVAVAAAPKPVVSAGVEVPVAGVPKTSAPPPPPAPAVTGGSAHAAGGVTWRWPADGQLLKRFTPGDAVPGIEIAGKDGEPVRAAADGVVVYSGNGLVGYGELVIIKHNDSLLSAYGHNSKRLVKEGQRVSAGQEIALMGSSGASRVELGFQIRKDGNPVDPMSYLPTK